MADLTGDQTTKLQRRLEEYVGSLASLTTTAQSNIVDAVNEVASEASDANSYAAVAMSKASDANSYAVLNSAAASQADSVAHVASSGVVVNASAASDAASAALVAHSLASDAASAAVVNASLASDVSSRVGVLASLTTSNVSSVTDAIKEIHRTGLGWHNCATIGYADLTNAGNGATEQEAVVTLPIATLVSDVMIYITTAFTGGGVASCTVAVGTAGNPDELCEEHDCLGTGDTTWILEGQTDTDKGTGLYAVANTDRTMVTYLSATAIVAEFTPDGANALADLTAGSCDVYVCYAAATTS